MSALLILRVTTQSPHFDAMVSAPGPGRRRQVERQPRLARPAVLGHNVERRLGANPRLRSASSMCCRSLTAANTWRRPPHGHCSPNARCPALGSAAATRGSTRPARRRLGLQRPQALARLAPSSPPAPAAPPRWPPPRASEVGVRRSRRPPRSPRRRRWARGCGSAATVATRCPRPCLPAF